MANLTVRAGAHYHRVPPLTTLPWIGAQAMSRTVTFGENCAYDSPAYNGQDVNKLFGLSFGLLPHRLGTVQLAGPSSIGRAYTTYEWVSALHWNSARFGWRWSKADQCIELLAYCYVNGVRNQDAQLRFPVVAQLPLGVPVDCRLLYMESKDAWNYAHNMAQYAFTVTHPGGQDVTWVTAPAVLSFYGLTHGLYVGGTMTLNHDIHVTINRPLS